MQRNKEPAPLAGRPPGQSGRSLLEELSLLEDVSPRLAPALLELRRQWIEEHELKTAAELILLDQAILGHVYSLLLGKRAGKSLAAGEQAPAHSRPADLPPGHRGQAAARRRAGGRGVAAGPRDPLPPNVGAERVDDAPLQVP